MFSSNSFAAFNYTGDPSQLTSSANITGNFDQLIGSQTLNGIVDSSSPPTSLPLTSSADTLINYTSGATLEFVLSGYSFANSNNSTESLTTSNNRTQITQGNIIGNVYTGLSHITFENPGIDCNSPAQNCSSASIQTQISNKILDTTNNTTQINGTQPSNITGDIFSGKNKISIKLGDIVSQSPSTEIASAIILDEVNTNTLNTISNKINISKNNLQLNNATSGYSGIKIQYGEVRGGASTTLTSSRSQALSQSTTNSNKINSNNNDLTISGNSNILNATASGISELILTRESSIAAPSNTTTPNFQFAAANSSATGNTIAQQNVLTASSNNINVTGNNNNINTLTSGKNQFQVTHSKTTANAANSYSTANASATNQGNIQRSTLTAQENKITILGNGNTIGPIISGYSQFKFESDDITADTATSATGVTSSVNSSATSFSQMNHSNISANNNSISISGTGNIISNLTAGRSELGVLYKNITGGTSIINGATSYGDSSLTINTANTTLSATNNTISLIGTSSITGNIHTGYLEFSINHGAIKKANGDDGSISVNLSGTRAFATGNTLSIQGEHNINNSNTSIYGGYIEYNPTYKPLTYDVFSGNTLNYSNTKPINIGELANFQTYNFTINPAFANSPTALITANHINLGSDLTNLSDGRPEIKSDIYVNYISAGQIVPNNSEFILMQSANLEGNGVGHRTDSVAQQGISLVYDVSTFIRGNQVIALVEGGPTIINPNPPPQGPEANPQLKALLAGNLSGLMLITRGADNISDNLLHTISDQNKKRGLIPFVNFSANNLHYETGSHIKSEGNLLTTGISYQDDQWTLGAFIEHGWDNYKTYHNFKNFKETRGHGRNRFTGLGVYGNYDFLNGWYTEASLRSGRLHTNFASNDIRHPDNDIRASYNISGKYYSLHLASGHKLKLNEKNTLDMNLKYLWSGTDGHNIKIAEEPIKFNKLNSHRVRLTGENTYQVNNELDLITGISYEYEFDGKAKGTALGAYHIPEPSVKGGTGTATVGVRYQPSSLPNFTLDLKANGYFGKREGGGGFIHMSYAF